MAAKGTFDEVQFSPKKRDLSANIVAHRITCDNREAIKRLAGIFVKDQERLRTITDQVHRN